MEGQVARFLGGLGTIGRGRPIVHLAVRVGATVHVMRAVVVVMSMTVTEEMTGGPTLRPLLPCRRASR